MPLLASPHGQNPPQRAHLRRLQAIDTVVGRRKEYVRMNRGKRPFEGWGLEEWIGGTVVFAIAAGIAITIWPGWPAIHGWVAVPMLGLW